MAPERGERGKPGDPGDPGQTGTPVGEGGEGGEGGQGGEGGERGRRGLRGKPGPRSNRKLLVTICVMAGVLLVLTAVMSTVTLLAQSRIERNSANIADIDGEAKERINQTCLLFESNHEQEATRLSNTYRYLVQLKPDERGDTINRFVLTNLPNTEADAQAAIAPTYCDAPGVGLKEPNPETPKRPPGLG